MAVASEWSRLFLCPLAAAACLHPFPPEESIAFELASNSQLLKHSKVEITLRPRGLSFNGSEGLADLSRYDSKFAASIQVLDKYGQIKSGRPLQVERVFTRIEGTWEAEALQHNITGFDRLEECAIVFDWDQAKGEYRRQIEGKDR